MASPSAIVIGAGPAGLGTAAELKRSGFDVTVIDKADRVGSSWTRHYDRLHLHTARRFSSLPGSPIPASRGQWVARADFVDYLDGYAKQNELSLRLGTTATSVTRVGDAWRVTTTGGSLSADIVVVATGYNHTPYIPDWTGLDSYRGTVVHSSEYRSPGALGAKNVLVIGTGNSGAEIAADLAEGGATVQLSVRTTPNIVPRSVAGLPNQYLVLSINPLPRGARDVLSAAVQRLVIGDLTKYGIPKAPRGIATQMERDDVTPTIDVGLVAALKAGKVTVVPTIDHFTADAVHLVDGTTLTPDAIVVATGYTRALETLVGDLDVIGEKGRPRVNADQQLAEHPGLYFIGYSNPITGNIRQLKIDAIRIAKDAARQRVI